MKKVFAILLLALALPVVSVFAEQRAAVEYVVTSVAGGRGVLTIENNTDTQCRFTVYSITGQVVRTLVVKPGSEKVELAKGFYIVKSDYGSHKVVVR